MLGWARLVHAAADLEYGAGSVEEIGIRLGFGSATALRNMLRRYVGVRPSELRRADGSDLVINRFRLALTDASAIGDAREKKIS
jgi:AraC-like DNA-binding protein